MSDLISRQAAIEHFQRIIDATDTDGRYNLGFIDGLEFCINHLSTMPSAQPEQKKGKWIFSKSDGMTHCSACGQSDWRFLMPTAKEATEWMPICPKCGAKMEGEA